MYWQGYYDKEGHYHYYEHQLHYTAAEQGSDVDHHYPVHPDDQSHHVEAPYALYQHHEAGWDPAGSVGAYHEQAPSAYEDGTVYHADHHADYYQSYPDHQQHDNSGYNGEGYHEGAAAVQHHDEHGYAYPAQEAEWGADQQQHEYGQYEQDHYGYYPEAVDHTQYPDGSGGGHTGYPYADQHYQAAPPSLFTPHSHPQSREFVGNTYTSGIIGEDDASEGSAQQSDYAIDPFAPAGIPGLGGYYGIVSSLKEDPNSAAEQVDYFDEGALGYQIDLFGHSPVPDQVSASRSDKSHTTRVSSFGSQPELVPSIDLDSLDSKYYPRRHQSVESADYEDESADYFGSQVNVLSLAKGSPVVHTEPGQLSPDLSSRSSKINRNMASSRSSQNSLSNMNVDSIDIDGSNLVDDMYVLLSRAGSSATISHSSKGSSVGRQNARSQSTSLLSDNSSKHSNGVTSVRIAAMSDSDALDDA